MARKGRYSVSRERDEGLREREGSYLKDKEIKRGREERRAEDFKEMQRHVC